MGGSHTTPIDDTNGEKKNPPCWAGEMNRNGGGFWPMNEKKITRQHVGCTLPVDLPGEGKIKTRRRARCTPPRRRKKETKRDGVWDARRLVIALPIPSSQLLRSPHPTILRVVRLGDVASFGLSGTGDVGLLGGVVGGW